MANLADHIETYLRELLKQAGQSVLEIRRCDLAEHFGCAPSQINYVLETRFTVARGYVVESRRGEGGYIRIIRCTWEPRRDLSTVIREELGESVTLREAGQLLQRMGEYGILREGEAALVRLILEEETGDIAPPVGDVIRAMVLRSMLRVLLANTSADAT